MVHILNYVQCAIVANPLFTPFSYLWLSWSYTMTGLTRIKWERPSKGLNTFPRVTVTLTLLWVLFRLRTSIITFSMASISWSFLLYESEWWWQPVVVVYWWDLYVHSPFRASFTVFPTGQIDIVGSLYLGSLKLKSYAGQIWKFGAVLLLYNRYNLEYIYFQLIACMLVSMFIITFLTCFYY